MINVASIYKNGLNTLHEQSVSTIYTYILKFIHIYIINMGFLALIDQNNVLAPSNLYFYIQFPIQRCIISYLYL